MKKNLKKKIAAVISTAVVAVNAAPFGVVSYADDNTSASIAGTTIVKTVKVWDGTADAEWYKPDELTAKDEKTVIEISTAEQLAGLAKLVNAGTDLKNTVINLACDIWLNTEETENLWTPVGLDEKSAFRGEFNGNNFTIHGLRADSEGNIGLFGYVENAKIRNVAVNCTEMSNGSNIGVICGCAADSEFSDCLTDGRLRVKKNESEAVYLGIICGFASDCKFDNCISLGGVMYSAPTKNVTSGGITGYSTGSSIQNCASGGIIVAKAEGTLNIAGICGLASSTDISDCFSGAAVIASAAPFSNAGGIAGSVDSVKITDCVCSGSVALSKTAGFAGGITAGKCEIDSSMFVGDIGVQSPAGDVCAGGVSAVGGIIKNCFAFPRISAGTSEEASETAVNILCGNICGKLIEGSELTDTFCVNGNAVLYESEQVTPDAVNYLLYNAVGDSDKYNELIIVSKAADFKAEMLSEKLGEKYVCQDDFFPYLKSARFIDYIENPGDADENGIVDSYDLTAIQAYLTGREDTALNPLGKKLADVNNDSELSIADAVKIQEFVLGKPVEFYNDSQGYIYANGYSGGGTSFGTTVKVID